MKKNFLHFDYWFLGAVLALLLLGLLVLAGVSSIFSQKDFGTSGYYFMRQLLWAVIPGLILGFIAFFIPVSFLKRISFGFVLFSLALMTAVFIPGIGIVAGGAPRWINLGFTSFQPSELLKLSFIFYLAAWLESRLKEKRQSHGFKRTFLPFIFILGFIILLFYFQSNASTLFLILAIAMLMYFLSGTPFWQTFLLGLGGSAIAACFIAFEPYRLNRFLVTLGLIKDPMGQGYQIKQSLISIGSGGAFGTGLGMSSQSLLPQTMGDSIFSIFSQQLGFIGSLTILFLFIFIFFKCISIANNTEDKFSQLFVIGFGSWICLQAFINISAMIGIIPLTGIPLPFISQGGSHVAIELIGAGVVLNISKKMV